MRYQVTRTNRVTTHLENLEKSGSSKVVREKSGEVKSGVFFQSLNKILQNSFFGRGYALDPAGEAYDTPTDPLVRWGGGHIPDTRPFPQLLQPQLLNN